MCVCFFFHLFFRFLLIFWPSPARPCHCLGVATGGSPKSSHAALCVVVKCVGLITVSAEYVRKRLRQVTSEMVRQLSATAFVLIDALCRDEGLSRAFWNLHRALFASDVNRDGQGIGRCVAVWWID